MENKEYCVWGYCFGSMEEVKQAKKEQKQAEYFEKQLEGRNPPGMLAAYDKILERKIFTTPVGWAYLLKFQEKLRLVGIPEEKIRPVPVMTDFSADGGDEEDIKEKITLSQQRQNKEKILIVFNILLLLLVIAMFAISSTSDHPHILNYRKEILNEYASWEQELRQRENEVRQKEAMFQEAGEGMEGAGSAAGPGGN